MPAMVRGAVGSAKPCQSIRADSVILEKAQTGPDHISDCEAKAICLFRALLEETGFPDPGVADMLVHGVQLVGEEPSSPIFAKRPRPRAISPSNLLAQAALRRESLKHVRLMCGPGGTRIEAETGLEKEAGFLARPYASENEVTDVLGTASWSLCQVPAQARGGRQDQDDR